MGNVIGSIRRADATRYLPGADRRVGFGISPDPIIASKYGNDNPASGIAFTRPPCVLPKLANYKGGSSSNDAANWVCEDGLVADTAKDAGEVLDRGDGNWVAQSVHRVVFHPNIALQRLAKVVRS